MGVHSNNKPASPVPRMRGRGRMVNEAPQAWQNRVCFHAAADSTATSLQR